VRNLTRRVTTVSQENLCSMELEHRSLFTITMSLTPYSTNLLWKLRVDQMVKKLRVFYGNFITVFRRADTGPYPEPDESVHITTPFFKI